MFHMDNETRSYLSSSSRIGFARKLEDISRRIIDVYVLPVSCYIFSCVA